MKPLSEKKKKKIEESVTNDRSNRAMLYNRFILFVLFVLVQLVVFIATAFLLAYGSPFGLILQLVAVIIAALAVLHIVNNHERPSTRVNWIVLILTVPFLGVPMYLMYGEGRPMRALRKRVQPSKAEVQQKMEDFYGKRSVYPPKNRDEGISYYLEKHEKYPLYQDGTLEYHKTGEEAFPVILKELRNAEKFILIQKM